MMRFACVNIFLAGRDYVRTYKHAPTCMKSFLIVWGMAVGVGSGICTWRRISDRWCTAGDSGRLELTSRLNITSFTGNRETIEMNSAFGVNCNCSQKHLSDWKLPRLCV